MSDYCNHCGADLSIVSHAPDCAELPDQDALEAREADDPNPAPYCPHAADGPCALCDTPTELTIDTWQGTYTVALQDGKIPVQVFDQGCNPWERGPQLVDPDIRPRWGQGWTVVDVTGEEHWYLTNWDSSG